MCAPTDSMIRYSYWDSYLTSSWGK